MFSDINNERIIIRRVGIAHLAFNKENEVIEQETL